jgi:hypothetical protein
MGRDGVITAKRTFSRFLAALYLTVIISVGSACSVSVRGVGTPTPSPAVGLRPATVQPFGDQFIFGAYSQIPVHVLGWEPLKSSSDGGDVRGRIENLDSGAPSVIQFYGTGSNEIELVEYEVLSSSPTEPTTRIGRFDAHMIAGQSASLWFLTGTVSTRGRAIEARVFATTATAARAFIATLEAPTP